MQFSKVFKGVLIALPVVTMMACTSTDSNQVSEEEARLAAERQAAVEAEERRKAEEAAAIAAAAVPVLSAEEVREQKKQELAGKQVVYFDFDRSNVSSEFYSILDEHAAFLAENSTQSIVIEGHCDSRGTPEYNIALGERRAKAIETYLLNQGVSAYQISVVSYGEEKPAVSGGTEAAFAKNRRGVLVYQ